ncbi:MAG TPA: hypothetical protein VKP60_03390 [Magnetospirillaceae bacterium]|nr:hypothetical protein [Magnetospirillaceae bacterium]
MSVKTLNRTICGIAIVALSGCAPPAPPPPPASPPVAQNAASSGPIALVAPPSPAPAKPAPAKRHDERKATAAVATVPAPPPAAPLQLVGMDEGAVQALLGAPSLVEDHAPGKTWRFRKHDCVLSVALYPDVQTRVFRTLSYEVTSDEHNAGAKQLCETKFGGVATPD